MGIYNTSNLKNGLKVLINDEPYVILDNQFHKPGKGQAFSKLKIRNLINGRVIDKTLKIGDSLDSADINEKDMQFLYTQGEELIFMDEETFDQISISTSVASSVSSWLKGGEKCAIIFFNGNAINITPPTFVELKISNTEPGLKGDTATNVMKDGILETGVNIKIPLFINENDLNYILMHWGQTNPHTLASAGLISRLQRQVKNLSEENKTLAELGKDYKNKNSHRAKATKILLAKLLKEKS